MLEALELRRLLSFTVADGVLTVTGTSSNDNIIVTRDGTNLTIRHNGVNSTTPAADVQKVVINGLAGNDQLAIAIGPEHGVAVPATLNGGDGNDRLLGGDKDDQLNGGAGKDFLQGGNGKDVLNGGDGDDVLVGGRGPDVFNGNVGIDTADYNQAQSKLVITLDGTANDGAAALAATATAPAKPAEGDNVKGDVENVVGGRGADKITGNASANRLVGGPGNDSLTGGDGNDILDGGPGIDSMLGGNGNDKFIAQDKAKDVVDGGSGTDSSSNDADDILTSIETPNQPPPPPPPKPPQPPGPKPPPPPPTV
jgi:Ca2+-binding RTX toxin-like protein